MVWQITFDNFYSQKLCFNLIVAILEFMETVDKSY